jgi:hypothetical protein
MTSPGTKKEWSIHMGRKRAKGVALFMTMFCLGIMNAPFAYTGMISTVSVALRIRESPVAQDLDEDGLPDDWEEQIINYRQGDGICTLQDVRPEDDYDHDRMSNWEEYWAGTKPVNPCSRLQIERIAYLPGTQQIQIWWQSSTNTSPGPRSYDLMVASRIGGKCSSWGLCLVRTNMPSQGLLSTTIISGTTPYRFFGMRLHSPLPEGGVNPALPRRHEADSHDVSAAHPENEREDNIRLPSQGPLSSPNHEEADDEEAGFFKSRSHEGNSNRKGGHDN